MSQRPTSIPAASSVPPTAVNGSHRLAGAVKPADPPTTAGGGSTIISPAPKLRRRPTLIALGIALIALSAAAAAWLTTTVGNTQSVLAVRTTLDRGSVITAADLLTANINADPALSPIGVADRDQVIGKRTAVDLAAGSLLTPAALTDSSVPAEGTSLVGISLTPAQLPAQPLRPGDTVRLVDTPRAQDDPPSGIPESTTATVVQAHAGGDNGTVIVDVTVSQREAVALAARAATGRLALILDPGTG